MVADEANLLDEVVRVLEARVPFCLIGGQAVNAYVEPLVSLDLDVVVAAADVAAVLAALPPSVPPRYAAFLARASRRQVLGIDLPVAALE